MIHKKVDVHWFLYQQEYIAMFVWSAVDYFGVCQTAKLIYR